MRQTVQIDLNVDVEFAGEQSDDGLDVTVCNIIIDGKEFCLPYDLRKYIVDQAMKMVSNSEWE